MGLGLGKVSMLFVVVETIISQHNYPAISIVHRFELRYPILVNLKGEKTNGYP
jgi:hypothetical protein